MLTTSIVTTFKQTIIIRFLNYWNCILSNLSLNSYFTPSLQSSLNRAVTMIPFEMQARTAQNPEFLFFFFSISLKEKAKGFTTAYKDPLLVSSLLTYLQPHWPHGVC